MANSKAIVIISSEKDNKQVKVKALLDTGNSVFSGLAISEAIHNQLGLGFVKLGGKVKGPDNGRLTVKGVSTPIKMQIDNRCFICKPYVIQGMTDSVNIGRQFMAKVNMVLTYGVKNTFKTSEGSEVEMICAMKEEDSSILPAGGTTSQPLMRQRQCQKKGAKVREKPELPNPVMAAETILLQPNSATFISVKKIKGEQVVEPIKDNELQVPPAVYKEAEQIAVLNISTEYRIVKKGEQVGESFPCEVGQIEEVQMDEGPIDKNEKSKEDSSARRKLEKDLSTKKKSKKDLSMKKKESVKNSKVQKKKNDSDIESERIDKMESAEDPISTEDAEQIQKKNFCALIAELKIEENVILRKNPAIKQKLMDILEKYQDVFSSPEKAIGLTNLIEFQIKVVPGAKPVRERVRPLNPMLRESLQEQISTWKKEDVIEEVSSPWAAAMVPVTKTDGSVRWAVDYRPLNRVTVVDSYPLPNIEENIEKLAGSQVFSTLDASNAYHIVPVEKESRPYLAFVCAFGSFTFRRMPFGATNAGATYSRFVSMMVEKLRSPHILTYLDDVLVATSTLEEQLKELEKALAAHIECGIRLKAKKTFLFMEKVNYLGYEVSGEGIRMRPDYVEKILQWPNPTDGKQLRSLLGFMSYYRSFIPNYSQLTAEMNSQRLEKKVQWTPTMEKCLEQLKEEFMKDRIRAYPRWDIEEPFELTTDFSKEALAVIVSQKQDGKEKFIAAAGRKTTRYEANYASVKGELAAVIFAVKKFEHLLRFRKFRIITDSAALRYLKTMKNTRGIWFRWLTEMESFQYEVIHRAGKLIKHVDGLSRCDHLPEPELYEESEQAEYVQAMEDESFLNIVAQMEEGLDTENLLKAQRADKYLQQVAEWIANGKVFTKRELKGIEDKELRTYGHQLESIEEIDGILYQKYMPNVPMARQRMRAIIPEELREQAFFYCHIHPASGHFGQIGTSQKAAQKFWWPGMGGDINRLVRNCQQCPAKLRKTDAKDCTHQPVQNSTRPGQKLNIDLVGPLPVTGAGRYKYIMTLQDSFTRYVAAVPIRNKEAITCVEALIDKWVSAFGCPEEIHSDQGREFVNNLWEDMCRRLEIKKTTTPPYSPQSNSVERFHRTLNALFRVYLDREDPEWVHCLPMAILAYNSKVCSATGVTPMEAWTGREAKLPIDLVLPQPESTNPLENEQCQVTMKRFHTLYQYMRKQQGAQIRRNAAAYTGQENIYNPGDWVWYFSTRKTGKPDKIQNSWIGPFEVIKGLNQVLVEIHPALFTGRSIVAHITRLRLYTTPRDTGLGNIPDSLDDLIEIADEEAEEIGDSYFEKESELPVTLGVPEADIMDHPRLKKGRGRPPTVKVKVEESGVQVDEQPGNIQPEKEKAEEVVGNSIDMERIPDEDEGKRKRGQATMDKFNGLFKKAKMFRKRSTSLVSLDDHATEKRGKLTWQDLAQSSDEEEEMNTFTDNVHTNTVNITQESEVPVQATPGAAGYDLRASRGMKLQPRQITKVPLKLQMALPTHLSLMVVGRSGLATKGILTHAGLVDPDYRGSVCALLYNSNKEAFQIQKGQRVAQALILPVCKVQWQKTDILSETDRDKKGFGSTGNI